jgi:hypothetical protein
MMSNRRNLATAGNTLGRMGRVTLELSDVTMRKATMLAAKKGVPLSTFLAYQIDELVEANDRYERAKASVALLFPETEDAMTPDDPQRFFERWPNGPPTTD